MFKPQNLTPPPLMIDATSRTIRPETAEGDEFYGLAPGTNGTAAITRRALAEGTITSSMPLTWIRACGKPAVGITFVPTERSEEVEADPWGGE